MAFSKNYKVDYSNCTPEQFFAAVNTYGVTKRYMQSKRTQDILYNYCGVEVAQETNIYIRNKVSLTIRFMKDPNWTVEKYKAEITGEKKA